MSTQCIITANVNNSYPLLYVHNDGYPSCTGWIINHIHTNMFDINFLLQYKEINSMELFKNKKNCMVFDVYRKNPNLTYNLNTFNDVLNLFNRLTDYTYLYKWDNGSSEWLMYSKLKKIPIKLSKLPEVISDYKFKKI